MQLLHPALQALPMGEPVATYKVRQDGAGEGEAWRRVTGPAGSPSPPPRAHRLFHTAAYGWLLSTRIRRALWMRFRKASP